MTFLWLIYYIFYHDFLWFFKITFNDFLKWHTVLVSMPQGWTSISDRSGSGRRSLLPGSGGRHHRAHPALHPGSCSQHLQCHADEPQLCSGHTGAVQLAAPPCQVKIRSETHSKSWSNLQKNVTILYHYSLSLSGPSQTPPQQSWRGPVSESERVCPCGTSPGFLLADSSGGSAPLSWSSSLRRPALQESAPTEKGRRLNGWSQLTRAVSLSNMAPVALIQDPKMTNASGHPDPWHGPMTSHWALRLRMTAMLMLITSFLRTPVPKLIL